MKKIISSLIVISLSILMLVSCGRTDEEKKDARKPNSTGKTSEILVVAGEMYWKSQIGKTVRTYFGQIQQGLPQREVRYTMPNIPPHKLSSRMFKKHRNIIVVAIDEKLTKAYTETKKDLWAAPQRVIKVHAPSEKEWLEEFDKNKEIYMALFDEVEIERVQKIYRAVEDLSIRNYLTKRYGISMVLPESFFLGITHDDFIWMRKETPEYSMGIMVNFTPYKDTEVFTNENILQRRNQMTQKYIPGELENTYMITSKTLRPESAEINFNGMFAMETRGLWEVEGDFMGGPFISYTFVDEANQRLITLDGFVYAPKDDKRDLLKHVEATMRTFKFVEKK
ncbi:MAG: DUF4837 family protein [Bacteroidales bacterium]|nr:DUF4837 family protein [Bacteroidales bacterium]